MSAISACIHCCNLARSCIAAHIFPANSACACAQNCNCCTPAPHFTCSTTSSDPPRQSGIHIYHTLHFPISISILKLSFLLLACLPSLVSSSHVWVGDYHFQNPHHHQVRVCVLWVAVFLCMESALCRQQSLPRDYICSHSQLWAVTLSLSHQPLLSGQKNKGLVKRHPNSLFWTNICPKL